jgi:hypothetical protein
MLLAVGHSPAVQPAKGYCGNAMGVRVVSTSLGKTRFLALRLPLTYAAGHDQLLNRMGQHVLQSMTCRQRNGAKAAHPRASSVGVYSLVPDWLDF